MPLPATSPTLRRRRVLGRALALSGSPLLALAGCASTWPETPPGAGSSSALSHLQASAAAQGLAVWRGLNDLNASLAGVAGPLLALLPDAAAGDLQLRLLPGTGVLALAQAGQAGRRQLLRRQALADGSTLWTDDRRVTDGEPRRAAALAADLHRLLLIGCLAVADHPGPVNWAEPQTLDGRRCDHLHLLLRPGLGAAANDRLSLFIDREQGLLRRLRVSLSGLGADELEVDLAGHRRLHGMVWPTRWSARLFGALPGLLTGGEARRWRLTGLDLNRGYREAELATSPWAAAATQPAKALPPT